MPRTSANTSACGSITSQLGPLKSSDPDAIEWFVKRFMPSIVEQARSRISARTSRVVDENDVAQDVLQQFLSQIDRFEKLDDRTHLFQILGMLTRRRAIDAYRKARAINDRERSIDEFDVVAQRCGVCSLDPNQASIDILDGLQEAIVSIGCPDLQTERILEMRLNGFSVQEISQELGRGERAIYRLLEKIRERLREFGFDCGP